MTTPGPMPQAARDPVAPGRPETETNPTADHADTELEQRGKSTIEGAYRQLNEKNLVVGIKMLRLGLSWYPRDREARHRLALLYLGLRSYVRARDLLLADLAHGYPGRGYLEKVFHFIKGAEDHAQRVALCDQALALHDPSLHPPADRAWLLEHKGRAFLDGKNWPALLAFTEHEEAGSLPDDIRRELRLLALLDLGRIEDATLLMDVWRADRGPTQQVLRLQARTHREAGRSDEMVAVLTEAIRQTPTDPRVHAFSIIQRLLAGQTAEAGKEIDSYLLRFGADEKHLTMLASPLAEIKSDAELARVEQAAAEQGLAPPQLLLARLGLLTHQRKWPEAAAQLTRVRASLPPNDAALPRLHTLELLFTAAIQPDETAQTALLTQIESKPWELRFYRDTVDQLRHAGRLETARAVLAQGLQMYPDHPDLLEAQTALAAHDD